MCIIYIFQMKMKKRQECATVKRIELYDSERASKIKLHNHNTFHFLPDIIIFCDKAWYIIWKIKWHT